MNYEERKQQKIERAEELARKARQESEQRFKSAKQISDFIPFGQPILVGHHSEGRHRRDIGKIENNMRKGIEASSKAEYYEDRAKRLENDKTISSDDPEAVTKLREKLEKLEQLQESMKNINKVVKNSKLSEVEKVEKLQELGLKEQTAISILEPDFCGRIGVPSYKLTNNNANMSTIKKRIQSLQARDEQETTEKEINGVKIIDNIEDNRLQAYFPGKPSEEIRTKLKRNGFRWSPSNGCWQSYRKQHSLDALNEICKSLVE